MSVIFRNKHFRYSYVFIGYENLIKAFEKARRVLEKDQGTLQLFLLFILM
jgi:hypothetical protein